MTQHAKLAPSAAYRWLTCPGSIRLTADLPEADAGPAAAEGTLAHSLAEAILTDTVAPAVTDEMFDYVVEYTDYIMGLGGQQAYEVRLDLNEFVPGSFGTSDALAYHKEYKHLDVADLKYGMNAVWPRDNSQLMLYAVGAIRHLQAKGHKVKTVTMHICQPRIGHWPTHTMKAKELLAWAAEVKPKAELCFTDDAPLNPSEGACRYCDAAPFCPALAEHTLEVVGGDFEVLPDVQDLTEEQVITVLDNQALVIRWMEAVADRALHMLEHGESLPGYKMVRSVTRRKFGPNAEEVLAERLGDAAYRAPELITVSAAEKLVGKKEFEELGITVKPEGKLTVAPESDRRKAVELTADDFSKIENAETGES